MSSVRKLLITIYCAENLISGKKYIGQSSRPIKWRRQQHYNSAKKANHKFAEALNYYPRESWLWYPLAEVECNKANEYEAFYIRDMNTYEDGYNTQKVSSFENKINSIKYSSNICSVYKPEFGTLTGTKSELARQHPELEEIRHLINGNRIHIKGWILNENKDRYQEIISMRNRNGILITLAHKEYGEHTLLQSEFVKRFGLHYGGMYGLITGKRKIHKGWVFISVDESARLETPTELEISPIHLYHDNYGNYKLSRKEFMSRFGLDIYALSKLEKQLQKSHKGWKLVKEEISAFNSEEQTR
jgi:hypothetical protein